MFLMMTAALSAPPLEAPAAPAAPALPDLASMTKRKACAQPPMIKTQKAHPGAEQFYSGTFSVASDGSVQGYEYRYTYANHTWKQKPGTLKGEDCVDVWRMTGMKVRKPARCPQCDFGIQLQLDVDTEKTTCERRLTSEEDNHHTTLYGVEMNADGSMRLRFESGNTFATGKHLNNSTSWISKQTCIWL